MLFNMENCQQYTESRNGQCLSSVYKNSDTKMKWECNEGHSRSVTFNKNTHCPACSSEYNKRDKYSKRICKGFLEEMTGHTLIKSRPKWLKGLRLDGYCKELNLAFEYNGIQHYEYNHLFHRTPEDFESQKERDQYKKNILDKKGIYLITIPYTYNCDNEDDLVVYLANELIKYFLQTKVPPNYVLFDAFIVTVLIAEEIDDKTNLDKLSDFYFMQYRSFNDLYKYAMDVLFELC